MPKPKRQKQEEALERDAAWSKLTPEQQLQILDGRPGDCKKQRERIIQKRDNPVEQLMKEEKTKTEAKKVASGKLTGEQKAAKRSATDRAKKEARRGRTKR